MAYRIETDIALGFLVNHFCVAYIHIGTDRFLLLSPEKTGRSIPAGGQQGLSRLCYAAVTIDRVVHWPAVNLAVTQTRSPLQRTGGPLFLALAVLSSPPYKGKTSNITGQLACLPSDCRPLTQLHSPSRQPTASGLQLVVVNST